MLPLVSVGGCAPEYTSHWRQSGDYLAFINDFVSIKVSRANVVSILSTFEISMAKDDQGRDIVPSCEYTSGLIMYVLV
jgi:hypothetical protein